MTTNNLYAEINKTVRKLSLNGDVIEETDLSVKSNDKLSVVRKHFNELIKGDE